MLAALDFSANSAFVLLIGAALLWYIASRAAVGALTGEMPAPGRRALGYWMPIAMLALLATVWKEPALAVGVIFASSVACVSLVIGVVTLTSPPQVMVVADRRRWAFLLPAAVLAVLAGFKARLMLMHALIFAVEGIAILLLWRDRESSGDRDYVRSAELTGRRSPILSALQLLFAIALAGLGAWTAILAGSQIAQQWESPGKEIIGAMLFGPALIVPMVGDSTLLAQRGQYTASISSAVAIALLNLCVLLPLVIVTWHVSHIWITTDDPPLLFAPSVWRVDAALLVVIGLWLLPVSIGRWIPSRLEGAALVGGYAAYMMMTAWANRNW